jgi:hypothetical protein
VSRDDANVLFRARDVLDRGDPDELVRVDDTVLARAAIIAPVVVARMLAEVVVVHLAELGGRVEGHLSSKSRSLSSLPAAISPLLLGGPRVL